MAGKKMNLSGYRIRITNAANCPAFKDGDTFSLFDNSKLIKTNTKSLEEFAKYIFENYSSYAISELRLVNRKRNLLFKKSDILG